MLFRELLNLNEEAAAYLSSDEQEQDSENNFQLNNNDSATRSPLSGFSPVDDSADCVKEQKVRAQTEFNQQGIRNSKFNNADQNQHSSSPG